MINLRIIWSDNVIKTSIACTKCDNIRIFIKARWEWKIIEKSLFYIIWWPNWMLYKWKKRINAWNNDSKQYKTYVYGSIGWWQWDSILSTKS